MKKQQFIRYLTESALMIALATILSLVKLIPLPMEGSLTLLSMLPICVIAFRYPPLYALGTAFVYSLFQLALGLPAILSWGLSVPTLLGTLTLDYLLAFTVLGLAGIFGARSLPRLLCGVTLALSARFFSHFLSGVLIFRFLETWELFGKIFERSPYLYSLCYNGVYMLPELLLTLLAVLLLYRIPIMRRFLSPAITSDAER